MQNWKISSLHLSFFNPKMEIILKTGLTYCGVKRSVSKIYWVLSFEDDIWLRTRGAHRSITVRGNDYEFRIQPSSATSPWEGYLPPTRQPHTPPPQREQPLNQFCEVIWIGEHVRGYDYQLKIAFFSFLFFFCGVSEI